MYLISKENKIYTGLNKRRFYNMQYDLFNDDKLRKYFSHILRVRINLIIISSVLLVS